MGSGLTCPLCSVSVCFYPLSSNYLNLDHLDHEESILIQRCLSNCLCPYRFIIVLSSSILILIVIETLMLGRVQSIGGSIQIADPQLNPHIPGHNCTLLFLHNILLIVHLTKSSRACETKIDWEEIKGRIGLTPAAITLLILL